MWFITRLLFRFFSLFRLISQPRITLHPTPAKLVTTSATSNGAGSTKRVTTLKEIIDRVPSLKGSNAWYLPTAYLASGHLMTIYCTMATFTETILYSRQLLLVPDGGTLALDFTPPISPKDPIDSRPILMVLHGLTGGSHESYVINVLKKVTKSKEDGGLGWRGCVVNFRGCAGTPLSTKQLYNGGYTDDLRCALSYISHHAPSTPLYGIGFSLGANVLAKYLGQEGSATPLKSAIVLGCPWDFLKGHVYLSSSYMRLVYSRAMAKNLRRVVERHKKTFEGDERVDWEALEMNPYQTLYEFDAICTAPLGGHKSAEAYYRYASASNFASNISIPLLSINASDDPIVAVETVPLHLASTNPFLCFVTTKHGGHLGWFSGLFNPERWIAKPVLEFFKEVEIATGEKEGKLHEVLEEREGGMRVVKGKENVGFKELVVETVEGGTVRDEEEDEGLIQGL